MHLSETDSLMQTHEATPCITLTGSGYTVFARISTDNSPDSHLVGVIRLLHSAESHYIYL